MEPLHCLRFDSFGHIWACQSYKNRQGAVVSEYLGLDCKRLTAFPLESAVEVGLECYDCRDVQSADRCNTTKLCAVGQACFLESTQNSVFTLGCRDTQQCHHTVQGGNPLVGRALAVKRQTSSQCMECCSADYCNMQLCSHQQPSACIDDESFDCARLNSLFNVCDDTNQAKKVCPMTCGLCNVVDGGWTDWNSWSKCDVTCENGTQIRTRTCSNPAPAHGGLNCAWSASETKTCVLPLCPVHGGWSLWSSWGVCSSSCGMGMQRRDRTCSNPYPDRYGDHCYGDSRDDRLCLLAPCADGGWSAWASWDSCTVTCGTGLRKRHRQCDQPTPSPYGHMCPGDSLDIETCLNAPCPLYFNDCSDIKTHHTENARSGIYMVRMNGTLDSLHVYCDMTTAGGGWTVFQRRVNGSVDFYRTFSEYEDGFGNTNGEFWLGLKYIQAMTQGARSELRVDLEASDGRTAYEVFKNFHLSAGSNYTLHIDQGTGTAGDTEGLFYTNGYPFSTKDHGNTGCATKDLGGWWYKGCTYANLNGAFITPGTVHSGNSGEAGVTYRDFDGVKSLKRTKMMFRRM